MHDASRGYSRVGNEGRRRELSGGVRGVENEFGACQVSQNTAAERPGLIQYFYGAFSRANKLSTL